MWKSLNPGEKVRAGDTVRYRSSSLFLVSYLNNLYEVVKTDSHYFEIKIRADEPDNDDPDRKVIKYMDVGYYISMEIWSGNAPVVA
jgi:hypothetical protein